MDPQIDGRDSQRGKATSGLNNEPVVVLRDARRDIIRHFAWLEAEAGTDTAERFLQAVDRTFARLAASPKLAAKVDSTNRRLADMRKARVDEFPNLLIFFTSREQSIEIIRVLHAASDWWAMFDID
jgi:toxin ParE1/3/4